MAKVQGHLMGHRGPGGAEAAFEHVSDLLSKSSADAGIKKKKMTYLK